MMRRRRRGRFAPKPLGAGAVAAAAVVAGLAVAGCEPEPARTAGDAARSETSAERQQPPVPRFDDGRVRLDRIPGEKGYWGEPSVSSLFEAGVNARFDERGRLASIDDAARIAPFRPWALALYRHRQGNGLADDPVRFCLPPAGPRHLHDPSGFRIIQDRNYDRIYVMFGGGNRNWRLIFLDGREPPNPEEVVGTYYGHSTGRWEGDTLVVESSGFNARFWFSNGGLPHTEALRLTESFTRTDHDTLKYRVTIDDPLTYTRPWDAEWTLRWIEGGEIPELFCEDERD
jgi:hypothetical protein